MDERKMFFAVEKNEPIETTVNAFMADFDDDTNIISHIERGEVVVLGGGAQPHFFIWMGNRFNDGPAALEAFNRVMAGQN